MSQGFGLATTRSSQNQQRAFRRLYRPLLLGIKPPE